MKLRIIVDVRSSTPNFSAFLDPHMITEVVTDGDEVGKSFSFEAEGMTLEATLEEAEWMED